MTETAVALMGYVAWTILLVLTLGLYRTGLVFAGKKKANEFKATGDDLAGFGARLTRAHANCYENLPAAAALMLYAIATDQTAITDRLALALLGARLLQSLVHLASTSRPAVLVRFVLYVVQLAILIIWIAALTHLT
jgi:uncharacterized MAPEG superfamily protein